MNSPDQSESDSGVFSPAEGYSIQPDHFHGAGVIFADLGSAMDCPTCGLTNPPTAQQCDCGYDFVDRLQREPLVPPSRSYKLTGPAKLGIVFLIYGLAFLGPRVLNQTQRLPSEPSGVAYALGSLLGELFVSVLIAWPIILVVERARKRRFRAKPR